MKIYLVIIICIVILVGAVTASFIMGQNAAKADITNYLFENDLEICVKENTPKWNYNETLDDFLANLNASG